MRVLDRLDTPAQVMSDLGHTLVQNPFAIALLGDQTTFEGPSRSIVYRWFTDPDERRIYPKPTTPTTAACTSPDCALGSPPPATTPA